MTKLNEEQIELLNHVAEVKTRTDARLAEVRKQYEEGRYDAEAPLRQAILEAKEAGVPIRQIGLTGLGTQDFATVRAYLPVVLSETEPALRVNAEPVSKVKGKARLEELSENLYVVTDVHGKNWEFWTIDFDGHLVVDRSNNTKRGADTFDLPVPYEVMQVLKKKFAKADLSSINEEEA